MERITKHIFCKHVKHFAKKGILICTTKQRFSSVYTFVVGNKNVPTSGNKNVPTSGNKNVPTSGNKNVPTNDKENIPTFDKEDIPTLSSTPEPRKRKVFEASTPFGKMEYHTEEAAREASIFCEKAIRQLYSTNKLKDIQAFCLHWLKEDKKTKKPLFKTKQEFYLPYEFKKFNEAQTE